MSRVRPPSPAPNFHGGAPQPRGFFHPAIRRGTQVVRERSAKPLYVGSIPTRASTIFINNLLTVCVRSCSPPLDHQGRQREDTASTRGHGLRAAQRKL